MLDVISEVISIEKKAEQMVEQANQQKEKIISDAVNKRTEEYQHFEDDKKTAMEQLHKHYEEKANAHISRTTEKTNTAISKLNAVMNENAEKWASEITSNIINI